MPTSDLSTSTHTTTLKNTPIHVTCPHCGNAFDIVPILAASGADAKRQTVQADPAGRALLGVVARRLLPLSQALGRLDGLSQATEEKTSPPAWRARAVLPLLVLGMALVAALLIWLGQPATLPGGASLPAMTPATSNQAVATVQPQAADEAAIIDTLTRYNSAESEAAARLAVGPLRPYMETGSPFAERRAAQLAERQRRNAPHRTILVRWAIGQIAITGTTAMVTTQETWSNQEAGAVAPEQATVRVSYTLHWDESVGHWLIAESEQMNL